MDTRFRGSGDECLNGIMNGVRKSCTPVPDSLPVDDDAGEMVDGKRHGYGTMVWPDGKKYVGEWKGGNRHGCGLVSWPDGQNISANGMGV